jgi:hypothetical protein
MASPNVKVDKSVKIRRRNTLPGPLYKIRHQSALLQKRHTSGGGLPSSISSRCCGSTTTTTTSASPNHARWHHLHQSKTNPYVGWFRHAPSLTTISTVSVPKMVSSGMKVVNVDTLWLRDWLVDGMVFHQHKKRRIVVKDYNFTQFKYQQDKIKSTLFQLKQVMENRTDTRDLNLDLLLLYQRRSGHLRGGGTDDSNEDPRSNELDDTTIEQYLQRQYASSTESITIKALSRIACWLLDIPVHPTSSSSISLKENHLDGIEEVGSILSYDDDDDETRSVCSYDNHDTISGSRFRTSMTGFGVQGIDAIQPHHENEDRYPVGHGLSSQAEAYYALGAVYRHILDSLDDIDRLDRWMSGSHSFYDCYTAGCPTCKVRPDTMMGIDPTSPLPPPPQRHTVPPIQLQESDGSVPSWAMARIGHILAHESQHF